MTILKQPEFTWNYLNLYIDLTGPNLI